MNEIVKTMTGFFRPSEEQLYNNTLLHYAPF